IAGRVDLADAVVLGVGDIDVARGIGLYVHRRVQAALRRRAAIAAEFRAAVARHGGDDSVADSANTMVAGVGDEQVAGWIERDAGWLGKACLDSWTAVAAKSQRQSPASD